MQQPRLDMGSELEQPQPVLNREWVSITQHHGSSQLWKFPASRTRDHELTSDVLSTWGAGGLCHPQLGHGSSCLLPLPCLLQGVTEPLLRGSGVPGPGPSLPVTPIPTWVNQRSEWCVLTRLCQLSVSLAHVLQLLCP